MKNKVNAIISVTVCLLMVISIFTACSFSKESEGESTTLTPDPSWQQGTDGTYQPVDVSDVELVVIVSEALGDEAKDFNGDLNSLSQEQLDKVKDVAENKGYIVETDENGNTSVKKDPNVQAGEVNSEKSSEIYSQAGVKENETVNDKQYSEISSAAKENGAEAVTDKSKNVHIITTTKVTTTAAPTTPTSQNTPNPGVTPSTDGPNIPFESTNTTKAPTTTKKTSSKTTTYKYSSTQITTAAPKIGSIKSTGGNTFYNGSHVFFGANEATADGVISVGNTTKGNANGSGLVVMFDASGNQKWEDTLKGNEITKYNDVCTLSDGSIIVVGETLAEDIVSDSEYKCKGTVEGVIVKYNSNGKRQWIKLVGGSGADMIYAVATTPDGGFVITGDTTSNDFDFKGATTHKSNGFVAKCDANGNILWKKVMGGSMGCPVQDVAVTSAGTIYTATESLARDGDFENLNKPEKQLRYTVVTKYKSDGTREWVRSYYDIGSVSLKKITAANDNGCVIAGYYTAGKTKNENSFEGIYNGGPSGTSDGMVVKINATGDTVWRVPLIGFENDIITDITPVNGGYAVTGYSTSSNRDFAFGNNGDFDGFIGVISNGGKLTAITGFGGSESDRSMAISSYGNDVYASGSSLSNDVSFANFSGQSDGKNAMGFAMKFNLIAS